MGNWEDAYLMARLWAWRGRGAATVVGVAALVVMAPVAAIAQDVGIDIPLETVVRGPEGSEHHLASEAVPDELVGEECTVTAVATNQRSVHPDNDLVVTSGGDQLILEDVESESFGESTGEGSLTLGTELTVTLVMGPDGVFSAGMVVEVRCRARETTTTTRPTTTTTAAPTTTTTPETTTTTAPTTTTTVAGTSTTTTVPATTTTSISATSTTTVPETTTTVGETTTTSTTPQTTTSTTPSTLAFTGIDDGPSAAVGAAALVAGLALVALTRRRALAHAVGRGSYTEFDVEGVRVRLLRPGD